MDGEDVSKNFLLERKAWPTNNFPFTTESIPMIIKAKGKQIPSWTLDENGLAGELMDSPVRVETDEEQITLIPMGAARLRITAFPQMGD